MAKYNVRWLLRHENGKIEQRREVVEVIGNPDYELRWVLHRKYNLPMYKNVDVIEIREV